MNLSRVKNNTLREIFTKYNLKSNKKLKSIETIRKYLTKFLKFSKVKAEIKNEKYFNLD